MPAGNRHYGISALLPAPVALHTAPLVVQYEVHHALHNCGGSYLKLLSHDPNFTPRRLHSDTPYSIM